jgi:hypothetical protein
LSAIVIFVPLSLWVFHIALTRYPLGWRAVVATIAAGVVVNGIIVASLVAFIAGRIGLFVLDAIQVINPAFALLIVGWLGRPRPT